LTLLTQDTAVDSVKTTESLGDDWSSLTKELIDALPRLDTRIAVLVVFAAIVLPWAILSKVDETGTARGGLSLKANLRLDAPVAGTVAVIQVKEGQTVKEQIY